MARAALKCSRRTRTRRRILGDVGGRERGRERGEDEIMRAFASNGKEMRRRSSRAFSLFVLLHFCVFVQYSIVVV